MKKSITQTQTAKTVEKIKDESSRPPKNHKKGPPGEERVEIIVIVQSGPK
jgi:hypothetical protein